MQNVAVFCGSKPGDSACFTAKAQDLAEQLAARNIGLVYGGASAGLMGVLADRALELGVDVTGVMPVALEGKEKALNGLTQLISVSDMAERKKVMLQQADGFIALPGGTGTLDELFEMLSLSQIGTHYKPCAVLDVDGYYQPLQAFISQSVQRGFTHKDYADLLMFDTCPQNLLARMAQFTHPHLR